MKESINEARMNEWVGGWVDGWMGGYNMGEVRMICEGNPVRIQLEELLS
jgi:hypothetical protein